jgi:hypothetical protein
MVRPQEGALDVLRQVAEILLAPASLRGQP